MAEHRRGSRETLCTSLTLDFSRDDLDQGDAHVAHPPTRKTYFAGAFSGDFDVGDDY